jgi:hypothetical protein
MRITDKVIDKTADAAIDRVLARWRASRFGSSNHVARKGPRHRA